MSIPTIDQSFQRERLRWEMALTGLASAPTGSFDHGETRIVTFVAGASDEPYVGYFGLIGTPHGSQCRFGALDPSPAASSLDEVARDIAGEPSKNDLKAFFIAAGDPARSRKRQLPGLNPLIQDFLENVDLLATRAHYLVRQDSSDLDFEDLDGSDDAIEGLASYDEFHALGEPGRVLVRDWSWMLKAACRSGQLLPAFDGEDAVNYAARVLEDIRRPAGLAPAGENFQRRLAVVLNLVRGADLGFSFGTMDDGLVCAMLGLADMPHEWIPARLDDATEDEWRTAIAVAEQTYRLARLMDRRPRSFVSSFPGSWEKLQREITDAADFFEPEEGVAYARLVDHSSDMLSSFENSVLLPTLRRTGVDVAGHTSFGTLAGDEDEQPSAVKGSIREMSAKLLLRDKGWRSIAELAATWSSRLHAIATVEARLSDHATWKVPFDILTLDLPGGPIEIKALASAQELLDEGVKGRDSDGVEGMDHCVPSYMGECAEGRSLVVSVRRRDAEGRVERLSTAQLRAEIQRDGSRRLEVAQHYARGNSPPSLVARQALASLVSGANAPEIANTMIANINRAVPSSFYDPARPGAVEAMLVAWEFALSRDVRKLSVEEFAEHAVALATRKATDEPSSDARLEANSPRLY